MTHFITNAHIINPDESIRADLVIEKGKIASLKPPGTLPLRDDDDVTDATGLLVLPGGIDPHVHLSLPAAGGFSADDFISGSHAALAGGVTHIIDFVTPLRGQLLVEALLKRRSETSVALIDVDLHMGISGWLPDMEYQMEECVKQYGIRSFKTYLAYNKTIGIDYSQLEKVMSIAKRLDAIVLVHAEEGNTIDALQKTFIESNRTHPRYHPLSRPVETETRAVERVIDLVRKTGCTVYFVHCSAGTTADLIESARNEGLPVLAETCPQYLLLDDSVYEGSFEHTAPYVFSPPARPLGEKEKLWEHLQKGTFNTIATDHCPFTMQQKKQGLDDFTRIPNGAGGLEFRIPLMYHYGVKQNRLSLQQWVKLCCSNAADIFGLKDKGSIAPGMDADIILFDPLASRHLSSTNQVQNTDINIYKGLNLTGAVKSIFKGGNLWDRAKLTF